MAGTSRCILIPTHVGRVRVRVNDGVRVIFRVNEKLAKKCLFQPKTDINLPMLMLITSTVS